jgi:hypothetical protein
MYVYTAAPRDAGCSETRIRSETRGSGVGVVVVAVVVVVIVGVVVVGVIIVVIIVVVCGGGVTSV